MDRLSRPIFEAFDLALPGTVTRNAYAVTLMTKGRRQFGSIRKLPSGRWQASYWHEGERHAAPNTFAAKADGSAWLSTVETDVVRGAWVDPRKGRETLTECANGWMDRRPDIGPRTREKYRGLLDRHILPTLGRCELAALQVSAVRGWWAELSSRHPSTAADAYRLLSTICNAAVADQKIVRSPCQVKGAGSYKADERPTASILELTAAVEAVPEHQRAALLTASWCQLRLSEILSLQRQDIDPLHGEIRIGRVRPKTPAGRRTLAIPANALPVVLEHLDRRVGPEPDAWLFPGENGKPLHRRALERVWERARKKIGRPDLHFHDLRHSGLTWAAATGATTAELMHRAGHASPVAALRYQHATRDRDRAIADALAGLATGKVRPISSKGGGVPGGKKRRASRT